MRVLRSLVEPAFAKDPPLKIFLPTTVVGAVVCVLGALGVLTSVLGILRVTLSVTGVGTWIVAMLLLVRAAGAGLVAYGGYQMYQYDSAWKSRVIYGLALYFATEIFLALFSPLNELISFLATAVAYYLVVLSRPVDAKQQQPAVSE
jgi:chromate transport protein ChrA